MPTEPSQPESERGHGPRAAHDRATGAETRDCQANKTQSRREAQMPPPGPPFHLAQVLPQASTDLGHRENGRLRAAK